MRARASVSVIAGLGVLGVAAVCAAATQVVPADAAWKILSRFSGKRSYYRVMHEGKMSFIRATYEPPAKTVILYRKLERPGQYRQLRWRWRVHHFPTGADERVEGRTDSAASVYLYFETTWRKFVIKYVWSVAHPRGYDFRPHDSSYLHPMHVVVLAGPPLQTGQWLQAQVDPQAAFRRFFGKEPPPLVGLGLLSDGDGTRSRVEADYADFSLAE